MKKIIYILAALTAMASCSNKQDIDTPAEGTPFSKGQQVTISASTGSNGQTRVVGTDNST